VSPTKLTIIAVSGSLLLGSVIFYFYRKVPESPIIIRVAETVPHPFSIWVNNEPMAYVYQGPQTSILSGFPLVNRRNKIEVRSPAGNVKTREMLKVYATKLPEYPEIHLADNGEFKVKTPDTSTPSWLSPIDECPYDENAVISACEKIEDALIKGGRDAVDAVFFGKSGSKVFPPGAYKEREWTKKIRADRTNHRVLRGKYLIMVYAEPTADHGRMLIDLDSKDFSLNIRSFLFYYNADHKLALYVTDSAPEGLRNALVIK
jgi:hypothetical protein